MSGSPGDVRSRRRGTALEAAIYQATLAELADIGFLALSMERVAERAGAGKASLYRRWPNRTALVLAAVGHALPARILPADQGSLRADLVAGLTAVADLLNGPLGEALRGVVADAMSERGADERTPPVVSTGASRRLMRALAERAVARGDLESAQLTDAQLEVAVIMVRQRFLAAGRVSSDDVVAIVDEIVVPLWRCHAGSRQAT